MIGNARKAAPLHLIKNNSILLLSETYGGVPYNLVIRTRMIASVIWNQKEPPIPLKEISIRSPHG